MNFDLNESFEAIAMQWDREYPKKLTELFGRLLVEKDNPSKVDVILHEIAALTLKTRGIRMEPAMVADGIWISKYRISMEAPDLNSTSFVNPKALERLKRYDLEGMETDEIITGHIDKRTGVVSGFFTQIRNNFMMSYSMLGGLFTDAELTALYLHEVGHAHTLYLAMGETLASSLIISEMIGLLETESDVEKRFRIGRAFIKFSGNADELKSDDPAAITAMILEGQDLRMEAHAGAKVPSYRIGEILSDQYAVRWGMGIPLASALAKLEKSKGFMIAETGFDPPWIGLLGNFLLLSSAAGSFVGKTVGAGVQVALKAFLSSLSIATASTYGLDMLMGSGDYPSAKQRIQRIRVELQGALRHRDVSNEQKKAILADLKQLDEHIDQIHSYGDITNKLAKYVTRHIQGQVRTDAKTELTEQLINNRLYEMSALLTTR